MNMIIEGLRAMSLVIFMAMLPKNVEAAVSMALLYLAFSMVAGALRDVGRIA